MFNKYIYDLIFDTATKFISYKGIKTKVEKVKRYINKYDVYINDTIYINIEEVKEAVRKNNTLVLI